MKALVLHGPSRQTGAALFLALIFLVVLMLVSLVAMQGTTLELRMATNQAQREHAFEGSESLRQAAGTLMSEHTLKRGWSGFEGPAVKLSSLVTLPTGALYAVSPDKGKLQSQYGVENLTTQFSAGNSLESGVQMVASVYPLGTRRAAGTGAAQNEGDDRGRSTAGGGASLWYEIRSKGTAADNAVSLTVAEYRQPIFN